ncbi:hypothetical protein [Azospirillum lipoferum]|nr:hypothetical protein [Azospirillum lipoferum]
MAVDKIGVFTAASSSSAGLWKSTTSSPAKAGVGTTQAHTPVGDKVSMSKLGEALTGRAADAFKHLDAKARGMLDGLVNSGAVKAEDVVKGLQALATAAVDGQSSRSMSGGAASPKLKGISDDMGKALSAMGAVDAALKKGEISHEDYAVQIRAAGKSIDAARKSDELAAGGDSGSTIDDPALAGINDRLQQFAQQRLKAASLIPAEDRAAVDKLSQAGFDETVYRDAFARYAADASKPDGAAPSGATAPQQPTGAPTEADSSASTSTANAAQNAPAVAATKPAVSDPGNAKAAASMLQSALEAGAKKTAATGILDTASSAGKDVSDSVLNSLVGSLKAGAGKDKTDTASSS